MGSHSADPIPSVSHKPVFSSFGAVGPPKKVVLPEETCYTLFGDDAHNNSFFPLDDFTRFLLSFQISGPRLAHLAFFGMWEVVSSGLQRFARVLLTAPSCPAVQRDPKRNCNNSSDTA